MMMMIHFVAIETVLKWSQKKEAKKSTLVFFCLDHIQKGAPISPPPFLCFTVSRGDKRLCSIIGGSVVALSRARKQKSPRFLLVDDRRVETTTTTPPVAEAFHHHHRVSFSSRSSNFKEREREIHENDIDIRSQNRTPKLYFGPKRLPFCSQKKTRTPTTRLAKKRRGGGVSLPSLGRVGRRS